MKCDVAQTTTPDFDHLRQLIEATLSELGTPDANWSCIKVESLGQGGHGFKLPPTQVRAVWCADRNEIELLSENGNLLKTVNVGPKAAGRGKAA
jgi:hypothetical protein